MTAYEETLHVNPEKNFEELNNEFAKVKLSEKLAYCVGDPALTVIYTLGPHIFYKVLSEPRRNQ